MGKTLEGNDHKGTCVRLKIDATLFDFKIEEVQTLYGMGDTKKQHGEDCILIQIDKQHKPINLRKFKSENLGIISIFQET